MQTGDNVEHWVGHFLRTIPEAWADHDTSALTELQELAIRLLTAAGMIERRVTSRLRMIGHPVAVEATIIFTGETGLAQAMEYVLADVWNDWRETFEKHRNSEQKDTPSSHCERIGQEQWRLTTDGVTARDDIGAGNASMVFDFVLRRGFFDGQLRRLPDGLISQRRPVAGRGGLERMQRVRSDVGPADVTITNWEVGGQVFAAAFAAAFAKLPQGKPEEPPAAPTPAKRKRSTERGDGRAKLIAALTKHHQYADGGCLNLEPIGNNELARLAEVDDATASRFFAREFMGHAKYKALCRKSDELTVALKILRGEYSPHLLYGSKPPGEDDGDAK